MSPRAITFNERHTYTGTLAWVPREGLVQWGIWRLNPKGKHYVSRQHA